MAEFSNCVNCRVKLVSFFCFVLCSYYFSCKGRHLIKEFMVYNSNFNSGQVCKNLTCMNLLHEPPTLFEAILQFSSHRIMIYSIVI